MVLEWRVVEADERAGGDHMSLSLSAGNGGVDFEGVASMQWRGRSAGQRVTGLPRSQGTVMTGRDMG